MNGDFFSLNLFSREFREMLQDLADNAVRRDQLDIGPNMVHRNIPGTSLFIDANSRSVQRRDSIILAKITAVGGSAGTFTAVEVRPDKTTISGGRTWDGSSNLPLLHLVNGVADVVEVHAGVDENGAAYWWFDAPNPFPVKVTQTGGSNGTGTTAASYTYTVTTLGDIQLGTSIAQEKPRENGSVTAGTKGIAYYDGTTLKLWDAGEKYGSSEECTS